MSRRWISLPQRAGETSRQAHADLPAGTFERELGKEGFFGAATHMYHRHPPTGWTSWEGPLRPRAFDVTGLRGGTGSPWDAPAFLFNAAVRLAFWTLAGSMADLARNADGDQLLFIHQGMGALYCDYGHLEIEAGDYVMLPRGTMWRIECVQPMAFLMIEA